MRVNPVRPISRINRKPSQIYSQQQLIRRKPFKGQVNFLVSKHRQVGRGLPLIEFRTHAHTTALHWILTINLQVGMTEFLIAEVGGSRGWVADPIDLDGPWALSDRCDKYQNLIPRKRKCSRRQVGKRT